MPQSRGLCGHKRSDWDTHSKCLSCCGCSRLAPCVISALWASDTWTIAESRRAHRSRRGTRSPLSIGSASSHRSRGIYQGIFGPFLSPPVRVTPAGSPYSPSDSTPGSSPVSSGRPRFPGFPASETAALSSSNLDLVTVEPPGSGPSQSPSPAHSVPQGGPPTPAMGPPTLDSGFSRSVSKTHAHRASRSSDTGHRASGKSHRAIHSEHRPKGSKSRSGPTGHKLPGEKSSTKDLPGRVPGARPGTGHVPGTGSTNRANVPGTRYRAPGYPVTARPVTGLPGAGHWPGTWQCPGLGTEHRVTTTIHRVTR